MEEKIYRLDDHHRIKIDMDGKVHAQENWFSKEQREQGIGWREDYSQHAQCIMLAWWSARWYYNELSLKSWDDKQSSQNSEG
jgi:hypothetical protein